MSTNERKWTSGPRTVESWEEASMFHAVVWGPERVKIAHFTCDAFDAEAVAATLADANIDRAAPEMYEALRDIQNHIKAPAAQRDAEWHAEGRRIHARAEAATRKADGRDSGEKRDECEGHPAGPFDPMGETVYCDGSCRRVSVRR